MGKSRAGWRECYAVGPTLASALAGASAGRAPFSHLCALTLALALAGASPGPTSRRPELPLSTAFSKNKKSPLILRQRALELLSYSSSLRRPLTLWPVAKMVGVMCLCAPHIPKP